MKHLLILACALGALLPAQGRRGIEPKPAPGVAWHETRDLSRIVVKFAEGAPVRLRAGSFAGAVDLAAANALLAHARSVRRLFERDEAALDAERAALLAVPQHAAIDPPADLNNYFVVEAADAVTGRALLNAFNALAQVELAFPEHRRDIACDPGDIFPVTSDYSGSQTYRDAAPSGVDHLAGRTIPGGRGEALQVTDVESGWYLDHEDIPQLTAAALIGPNPLARDHGLAVIGELASEWDEFGMTGLADLVRVKVHSHQGLNWASSVNTAASNTPAGGVVVLEVQLTYTGGQICPMEVRQDVFDATRNATMAGKHVIAAAGNGNNNLDNAVFNRIFDRTFRDSGAVICGATDGGLLVRAGFSNYGSIVDANGWGYRVYTTGYGDLFNYPQTPNRQSYTATFSGTSSATPIVTGAAVSLLGIAREQLGRALGVGELRTLLRQNGTDVPNGQIGKRPDLRKLLQALGLPRGLEITREGRVGTVMDLRLTAPAGAPFVLAMALARGDVDLGPSGRLLLDPAGVYGLAYGTMPPAGTASLSFTFPNDLSLRRRTLFLQSGWLESQQLRLGNSVYNFVP
jgi:hypothetical protein